MELERPTGKKVGALQILLRKRGGATAQGGGGGQMDQVVAEDKKCRWWWRKEVKRPRRTRGSWWNKGSGKAGRGARHGDSMEVRRNVTKTIHDITNLSYVPKCLGHLEIMMVPTFLQSQRIPTQDILLIWVMFNCLQIDFTDRSSNKSGSSFNCFQLVGWSVTWT